MRNIRFIACVAVLILAMGCTGFENQNHHEDAADNYIDETIEKQDTAENPTVLYGAEDIVADEGPQNVVDYYSPDGRNYIREVIPEFIHGTEDADGCIGDNVLSHNETVLWSQPVYIPGEPSGVADVSLAKVQWLDDTTAMINGSMLYSIETGERVTFNERADVMLNYALNSAKDKLACSYLEDGIYRLSIYDFAARQWGDLFEGEIDRTYFFDATLVWRSDNEIIFTTGVKRAGVEVAPDSELDVWIINTDTGESRLLIKEAILCCGTGSFVEDKLLYAQYEQSDDGEYRPTIRVYGFNEKASVYEFEEEKISNQFWLVECGILGFYDEEANAIKLYSDQTYALLGSVDISSVCKPDDALAIEARGDFVKLRVYSRQTESSEYYKVDISDVLNQNTNADE